MGLLGDVNARQVFEALAGEWGGGGGGFYSSPQLYFTLHAHFQPFLLL